MTHIALADLPGRASAPGTVARLMVDFALQPDGAPACFPLVVVEGVKPGPTAALVAGIHGDEYEGPAALWRLARTLDPSRLAGRVLVVPVAHLAAFSAGTRTSPVDGQNLARIFPGDPEGTRSFRLAHALFEGVVAGADFLVDFHSGGVRLAFLDVCGFYAAADGVPEELAARSLRLARDLGLSHVWKLPARAGVLSYEAMRRGIVAAGPESGGRGGCVPADVDGYHSGILRILARRGMIDADVPGGARHDSYLDGDWALAPVGGFVENHVALGARVVAGEPLATIVTPLGEDSVTMTAAAPGLVMGVRHLRVVEAGEWATCAVAERRF